MPNYCQNYIKLLSKDQAELRSALQAMLDDDKDMDFDKMVPMPAILERIKKGTKTINGEVCKLWIKDGDDERCLNEAERWEIAECGYSNSYDWSLANWGCKWNASNTEINNSKIRKGIVEVKFETPWNPPYCYLDRLRDLFPKIEFEFRMASDDDVVSRNSQYPNDITNQLERGIRMMVSLAAM